MFYKILIDPLLMNEVLKAKFIQHFGHMQFHI